MHHAVNTEESPSYGENHDSSRAFPGSRYRSKFGPDCAEDPRPAGQPHSSATNFGLSV